MFVGLLGHFNASTLANCFLYRHKFKLIRSFIDWSAAAGFSVSVKPASVVWPRIICCWCCCCCFPLFPLQSSVSVMNSLWLFVISGLFPFRHTHLPSFGWDLENLVEKLFEVAAGRIKKSLIGSILRICLVPSDEDRSTRSTLSKYLAKYRNGKKLVTPKFLCHIKNKRLLTKIKQYGPIAPQLGIHWDYK